MYISNYHSGRKIQRGKGIGSIFNSIFRTILPIGKKIVTSATAKSLAKSVRDSLANAAINTVGDVIEGDNLKEAAQKRLNESRKQIGAVIKKRNIKSKQNYSPKLVRNPNKMKRYHLLSRK